MDMSRKSAKKCVCLGDITDEHVDNLSKEQV